MTRALASTFLVATVIVAAGVVWTRAEAQSSSLEQPPPLFRAIRDKDIATVTSIAADRAAVNQQWRDSTPLIEACLAGNSRVVEVLLSHGGNPLQSTPETTVLHTADYGIFLGRPDPERLRIVDLILRHILQLQTDKAILELQADKATATTNVDVQGVVKAGIRQALLRRLPIDSANFVAIQFYNVVPEKGLKNVYRILCDIAVISADRRSMFELSSCSRKMLPAPKSVENHMWVTGGLRAFASDPLMVLYEINDEIPAWNFQLTLTAGKGLKVDFIDATVDAK